MTDEALFSLAKEATARAYAPYSGFCVGTALLCKNGKVYIGANIENASYGATVCAERTALWQAVLSGNKDIEKIAVAAKDNTGTFVSSPPCGICRQALSEFTDGSLQVVFGTDENLQSLPLRDLLPCSFSL